MSASSARRAAGGHDSPSGGHGEALAGDGAGARQRHRAPRGLGPRALLALAATRAGAAVSRSLRLGSGSVVGGRIGLAIEPSLVALLTAHRPVAVVSGTNGKTTTTRMLAEALRILPPGPRTGAGGAPDPGIAWSAAGANMPAGIVAALASAPAGVPAVLEVDESYLPGILEAAQPGAVALLNLTRDQLDRVSEVRMLASRWQGALGGYRGAVVANADDPLVVWAAESASDRRFVGAGQLWRFDAYHCPACDARIEFAGDGPGSPWACTSCGLRRPETVAEVGDGGLLLATGQLLPFELAVPGRFNRANAAVATIAAVALGAEPAAALAAISRISEVAGRFATVVLGTSPARLLLAKNPAGWTELVELVADTPGPLVVAINARLADGFDPSWLWDVPFERLAGRLVVATGERRLDLAVRLLHAGVAHQVAAQPVAAVEIAARHAAAAGHGQVIEAIGNYTAFQDLRRHATAAGGRSGWRRPAVSARRAGPVSRAGPVGPAGAVSRGGWDAAGHEADPPRPAARAVHAGGPAAPRRAGGESALRVVVVHPDLLGTYGDGGNGRVLADRALWRDIDVELVLAPSDRPLPERADCYCLGGGEDGPQVRSAEVLHGGALGRAVASGAVVLAVCAGFQIAGNSFPGPGGSTLAGLGLLDASTTRERRARAVGEVVARPLDPTGVAGSALLSGFENHASITALGEGVTPLAAVARGTGNDGAGFEGAVAGKVVATYLHGPVLARNPALADGL
ncbi:MAG TPA: MurT ligase domain-containing protein, partial [Acidimicrobiales bacterium]|nr:MurT ligase domain-containing protein [Acidimicrobiales bacterium]